jgi:hypothetical protein
MLTLQPSDITLVAPIEQNRGNRKLTKTTWTLMAGFTMPFQSFGENRIAGKPSKSTTRSNSLHDAVRNVFRTKSKLPNLRESIQANYASLVIEPGKLKLIRWSG